MNGGMLADMMGPDGLIMIVVLAVVLLFGGKQLPKLARGLGSASHEFKKGIAEGDLEPERTKHEVGAPTTSQPSSIRFD